MILDYERPMCNRCLGQIVNIRTIEEHIYTSCEACGDILEIRFTKPEKPKEVKSFGSRVWLHLEES